MEVETLVDGDAELFVFFLLRLIVVLVCVDDFDFAGEGKDVDLFFQVEVFDIFVDLLAP